MCAITMPRLTTVFWAVALLGVSGAQDLCGRCECLPAGPSPTQAICHDNSPTADKIFLPWTTAESASIELIYIYGMKTVNFTDNSFTTERPITLFIQNCSYVNFNDHSIEKLRTLLIRDADRVDIGILPQEHLWTTVLEDIKQLSISSASLSALYSVTIGHIGSLSLVPTAGDDLCSANPDFTFTLLTSQVSSVPSGGMSLCGGHITINSNTFNNVEEEGFQISTEGSVAIVNNLFKNVSKQAFNLTSPEIHITSNHFVNLPAGTLRGVSTLLDSFFTNNTVSDIDLGGVLLDMGWDMIIERNIIDCDCASKRTSILNPKHDMLYLTNSSMEKLQNIFRYNFCNLNCTVTLKAFSYALSRGEVCVTNNTKLEHEVLCNISTLPEVDSTTLDDIFTTAMTDTEIDKDSSFVSAASKPRFLVPLGIVAALLIVTSSVLYGCKEMFSFRFTFKPDRDIGSKISLR
uniref:Right handed beta helix domain-containing protein n=1 Tax=Homalodisca liturata TaxID=320908 RepID=A0A1B6JDL2_9HEMI